MRRRRLFVCLLITALASCDGIGTTHTPQGDSERKGTIYNGQPDPGHPSVGMVIIDNKSLCTATLVGKRTMLTAAHCVYQYSDTSKYEVRLGNQSYQVESRAPHPQWQQSGNMDQSAPNDVGVLRLKQAPSVTPTPIGSMPPQKGQMISLVGYGVTDYGKKDSQVKRVAVARIDKVEPGYIGYGGYGTTDGAHRPGDSGGPSLVNVGGKEVIIGVHSMGNKQSGFVVDCRVDTQLAWIKQQAAGDVVVESAGGGAPGTPPGGSPPGGNPPGSQPGGLGQPCTSHSECITMVCGAVGGEAQCTFPCSSDWFCTPGSQCYATQIPNLGICWPPLVGSQTPGTNPQPPPPGGFGEACGQASDCQSQLCADVNGYTFCTAACGTGDQLCPLGSICMATQVPGLWACFPTM